MQLEASNISFGYGKEPRIIHGLNLTFETGEIVGLSGPSGCGKTTLARILSGYVPPKEGTVKLNGSTLPKKGYSPVQLVFQHPEKAVNTRWFMGSTLNEGWEPDEKILKSLGIEKEWLPRRPNELSGGELQRFCVARALGPGTRFLIADEMTSMLDAITQAQIWHVVLEIARMRSLGVIVISHEHNLIKRICTRVVDLTALK